MRAQKIKNYLSNLILTTFMSFSLVYAMTTSLVFDYNPFILLGALLLIAVIFSVVFLNRITTLVSVFSLAAFAMISGIIYLSINHSFEKPVTEVEEFIIWIYDYIVGYDVAKGIYPICLTILLCISVTLYVFIFTFKTYSFPAILILGAGTFVIQWAYDFMVSIIPFYLFVLFILIYYMRHIFHKNSSSETNDFVGHGTFTAWVFPVSAAVFLIAFIFTTFTQPIKIEWLDTKINEVITFIENSIPGMAPDYFSVASTGFGREKGRLGGRVRLDGSIALEVETPRNIYLKGASYDTYTGFSWLESDTTLVPAFTYSKNSLVNNLDPYERQNNIGIDFIESSLGPIVLDEDSIPFTTNKDSKKKHVYMDEIKITYRNLNLKSLFLPLKTYSLNFNANDGASTFISSNDSLSMGERRGNGFTYTLTTYNFDYGNDYLKYLLRKSKKRVYDDYIEHLRSRYSTAVFSISKGIDPSYSYILLRDKIYSVFYEQIYSAPLDLSLLLPKLAEHSRNVYSRYLQLPDTLPGRVKTLAVNITSGYNNNYDKVKAIENYLASNYPYTLSPGRTPKERDFVDYFLFEQKKGYCTYYASAMTVMVRSLGIPARYVEGYILPPNPVEKTSNTYLVTNEQAHAWVEVYFEGFGWVPFEPTAPFTSSFYAVPEIEADLAGGFMDDLLYREYYERLEEYRNRGGNLNIDIPTAVKPDEKVVSMEVILAALVILLAAFLVFIMMFNFSRSKVRLYNFRKLEPRESVIEMFKYYFKVLSLQGYSINPGETPFEYSRRISDQLLFERFAHKGESLPHFLERVTDIESLYRQSKFISATEIFMKARYSLEEVTEDEKQHVYSYHESFEVQTRDNLGRLKFFIYKYLLGRI